MLFHSYEFLFVFLPLVFLGYFGFLRLGFLTAARLLLLGMSWLFYAYWNPVYLPLLFTSIAVNFGLSRWILSCPEKKGGRRKQLMVVGVLFNLGLLGWFKYADFLIGNVNLAGADLPLMELVLPLAISFFSLQQIAFIVDAYRGVDTRGGLLDYCLFVSFFPQLIAGPIVHHREIIPQLRDSAGHRINYANLCAGVFLVSIGLFKKVVLADSFAVWADNGFDSAAGLSVLEAWVVSYGYTLQLYFDFSGYSDIALGLALLFNISLPQNFNSPYQATSIISLWQRWHMTLTRFVNLYVYRPLLRAMPRVNFLYGTLTSFLAMVVVGIWHGAAWSFVLFGAMQGGAVVINHIWRRLKWPLPSLLGWLLTFHFFSFSLVIFRAREWADASRIYQAMLGMGASDADFSTGRILGGQAAWLLASIPREERSQIAVLGCLLMIAGCLLVVSRMPNSNQLVDRLRYTPGWLLACVVLFVSAVLMMGEASEFIYFQF